MTGPKRRLLRWQAGVVVLLVTCYAGYYLCRSNLSVAAPLIVTQMASVGGNRDHVLIQLGLMQSLGVLTYALGKFLSGGLCDYLGGRRTFLAGMLGTIVFTSLFAFGGSMPVFTALWIGNRLVQSLGWPAIVKLTSRWFSFSAYGTAMSILSLSYLFGDAAARSFMSLLIHLQLDWREVFLVGAAIMLGLLGLCYFLLRESPRDFGLPEPAADPRNVYGDQGQKAAPRNLAALLGPLFRSPVFWLICFMSLTLTLLRETFNTWTPTYITDVVGLDAAAAALASALFPLLGGVSVLLAGYLSDRVGRGGRASIILLGLLPTCGSLALLAFGDFHNARWAPVVLIGATGLLMIGPYSYLGGALALDFGGKQGSATAGGIIDGIGYLGGYLAGDSMARVATAYGWRGAFMVLTGVAILAWLAALVFWLSQRRATQR